MLKQRVCCDTMQENIDCDIVQIKDQIRVRIMFGDKWVTEIDYCPWCGRKIMFDRMWEE